MDYNLLTAVHPRKSAPVKMDAKQEQEYYDRAAQSLEPLEEAQCARHPRPAAWRRAHRADPDNA